MKHVLHRCSGSLLSHIYAKKFCESENTIITKYKFLLFTFYKREVNRTGVYSTFCKLFHHKRALTNAEKEYLIRRIPLPALDCAMPMQEPLVSVIVPNYNHAPYLKERLDSIYHQTYKNIEVILLDDASTDGSQEILAEYAHANAHNTRLVFNEKNSGKVFLQWNRGLELAHGDFIWIAESDDYCDDVFLENVLKGFVHQSVMLSFARSVFMRDGLEVWILEDYLKDLPLSWDAPFVMASSTLVKKAFAIKNVIPNVSSAVFRNVGRIPDAVTSIWADMSLCGDWLFYLWLIRGGAVSYTDKATNYYRIHPQSTSLRTQASLDYYKETFRISCFVAQHYRVDMDVFEKVKANLLQHYEDWNHKSGIEEVGNIYDLDGIKACALSRKPNVAICGYSLVQGGGEIFPVYLANQLKRQNVSVTFVDFRCGSYDEAIRCKLDRSVPLVELANPCYIDTLLALFDIDIVHTHEGTVDCLVSRALQNYAHHCKQIITLHGYYEAVEKERLKEILDSVVKTCACFVYIADKNLLPLEEVKDRIRVRKIGNGLPVLPLVPHERAELGIGDDDFCVTLVSRGILEKGWMEAIDAVRMANEKSSRLIHLILIGEGECYDLLKGRELPAYIHLMGRRGDPRNYFAMSDVALLPSRFKGESFPLVVIESLMSGTPVIASDIGEIRNMLANEDGTMAGVLFQLVDGKVPVDTLSQIIVSVSMDRDWLARMKQDVLKCVGKFDIERTAKKYLDLYLEV